MDRILRDLRSGEFQLVVRMKDLDRLLGEIDRSTNRLALGILVGSLIVGSSVVTHASIGPKVGQIPMLGVIGYVSSAILGLWLVVAILRTGGGKD